MNTPASLPSKKSQAGVQRALIQAAGAQNYSAVRDTIRTGDVLLFRGKSPLSRVIRWGSDSVYSHAGFTAWWDDRLLVFQSTGRGAELVPASLAVSAYDGQVDLFRLQEPLLSRVDAPSLITRAVALLGRHYAKSALVGLMWRMLRRRFRGRPDATGEPHEVFCSQYVSYCFRAQDLDLVPGTDDASTSPGDLANSPFLKLQAILQDDPQTAQRRRRRGGGMAGLAPPRAK